jgi:hypothetical protein
MFFTFPEAGRGVGVVIGEYEGVVRVPRRVFQSLLLERPTPERCVEAYYLQRTRFERVAERKLRPAPVGRGRERRDRQAGLALSTRWKLCREVR